MIQFLDRPEEILLELIIRFLSISECANLVSVRLGGGFGLSIVYVRLEVALSQTWKPV
jgi:hypothetical protein